ncbi:hypothetical protein, partial [Salmonella sp. s54836]|uniref:hypothetical protein n=1 Tax=Salmonella sp. s54836 TaxID=3159673 RepID=UPI00397FB314
SNKMSDGEGLFGEPDIVNKSEPELVKKDEEPEDTTEDKQNDLKASIDDDNKETEMAVEGDLFPESDDLLIKQEPELDSNEPKSKPEEPTTDDITPPEALESPETEVASPSKSADEVVHSK